MYPVAASQQATPKVQPFFINISFDYLNAYYAFNCSFNI